MRCLLTAMLLAMGLTILHAQEVGWMANGRDLQGTRYLPARRSPARTSGVSRWRGRTAREKRSPASRRKPTAFEATPLVVDGTMYVGTPLGRVIALDPATGRERWVFDPKIARDVTYGDFASRGVSTWLDESAPPTPHAADASSSPPRSHSSLRWTRRTAESAEIRPGRHRWI